MRFKIHSMEQYRLHRLIPTIIEFSGLVSDWLKWNILKQVPKSRIAE